MVRIFVLLATALGLLWTVSSPAEEAVLGQLYGSGVHAYFSGDYIKAFEDLNSAVAAGSRDPRVFYFRGLVLLNLGRSSEAAVDFQTGADLETKDVNKFYNVGRALERVQGSARQQLETYRVAAHMAALEEAERVRKARYEAIRREEARVLQQQAAEAESVPARHSAEAVPAPAPEAAETETPADTTAQPPGTPKAEEKPEAEKAAEMEKEESTTEQAPEATSKAAAEEDPFASKPALDKKPAAKGKSEAGSKSTGKKSVLGALGKAPSKGVAATAVKPAAEGEKPEAGDAEKPADKPAESAEPSEK